MSNPLRKNCFENDFKVLHNSPSEQAKLPPFLPQKVQQQAKNEDYLTTFKSKSRKQSGRNRAGTHDTTFSFACLPAHRGVSPRSNDRSQRLETDNSYNVNTTKREDTECQDRQKPIPSSAKKRVM